MPPPNYELQRTLRALSTRHPDWFAKDFAERLGYSPRYIRRQLARLGLARPTGAGGKTGPRNPAWRGGRILTNGGYVRLSQQGGAWEHHTALKRRLRPGEVVDHIDGITIHNDPRNLRVFASNAEHLRATLDREKHNQRFSRSGRENMFLRHRQPEDLERVDIHALRRARGDVQLRVLLRAALELGTSHPCLSGMTHWFEHFGIAPVSRPNLERAWDDLCQRFERDLQT